MSDNTFDSKWRNVAIMIGEKLADSGPTDYYKFTPDEWFKWANNLIMSKKPAVAKNIIPSKPKNLFSINPYLDMALDKATLKSGEIWRMDFWDYTDTDNDYCIDLDRETLKMLAEFILKYLENN